MFTPPIDSFMGPHRWLSNFYPSIVTYKGMVFPTVENAYQAIKFFYAGGIPDPQLYTCTPAEAKRLGRTAPLHGDTLVHFNNCKVKEMHNLLTQKFAHPHLRELLLATGDAELIEGNYWGDTFWGVCKGKGENWLGRTLMRVRAELSTPTSTSTWKPSEPF